MARSLHGDSRRVLTLDARVSLFGIRHHGPGSAASLVQALDALDPAYVLIEGPPEASDIIGLVTAPGMRPPLAILTHPANSAEQARFHPFAEYSPEWQAMRWATLHARPVEFIDEPLLPRPEPDADTASEANAPDDDETGDEAATEVQVRRDPLSHLAQSAGHSDGEAWWNALIEQHVHAPDVFAAIERAMTALRDAVPDDTRTDPESDRDLRREAFMRIAIRKALKACDGPIAVVCGAWHVPGAAREDVGERRPGTRQGPAARQGRCLLGAMDRFAPRGIEWLRRRCHLARLVPSSLGPVRHRTQCG